ncbi:MaoC family dehydratase [Nocardia rhizosphaerihabitans]|uniref:MaoC family dehydratase n=2 Tax=Nocardia rhizosphaerihabitans TaxID=1691570 RepID=A0ABQ2KF52_9NOCA|nr:MaoC family dehydratase [Nocardia rhizosphaerihabitans]
MHEFPDVPSFLAQVGTELGVSDWVEVVQERIDLFAEATGDHQWIHVDIARAAEGPFGGTIAHGYLTVSMVPVFLQQVYTIGQVASILNYGLDKVRFPHPVISGARVRGRIVLAAVEPATAGHKVTLSVTVEIEGVDKPACVAQVIHIVIAHEKHINVD